MGSFYYPSFDVVRLDAAGDRVVLPALTVNVYNVTASASLGTLVSDANGIIAAGSFTADLFDVIEISHATYPLTCRFTLQATEEDAFTAVQNNVSAYVAENLYADTTESKAARMYIVDLDNTARQPVFAAELKPGVETKVYIPQTNTAQHLRLPLVSEDIEGQFSTNDILTAPEYFDITIPALTSVYQPLDATLTALAGANWAANSLAVGSGVDTVAQVTFAANTFPARSSSGNLVAKTITDFGLSLVDDADASAARTTLGLVIGTNVQAYDADLTTWAGITPGTGVGTALAVNVGTAGAFVVNGGALGTPSSGALTNCTFPTLNQNTTGSAAKWTTARNLAGNSVDGSANVAFANKFIVQGTADSGLSAAQFLGALGTGIVKNTTTTGVLSIAVAGDFPTLNQNTTGSAATLTTARAIYGNNFDGSAALTQIIASTYGGTGNGFAKFSGPATSEKTFTLPNASATILTDNAAVTVAQGGTGRATSTTAYGLIAAGTTATGAHQTLAAGATTEILVGGGASALPVWTTATGSGSPVRATSPTLTTPNIADASTLTFLDATGSTYDGYIQHGNSSPYRVMNYYSKAGTGSWQGAHRFNVNFNNGSSYTGLAVTASTVASTAYVGVNLTAPEAPLHTNISSNSTITEVAGIFGRSDGTAGNVRGVGIAFKDGNNPTLVAGIAGYRFNSGADYNGHLDFYTNNSGGSVATTFAHMNQAMRLTNVGLLKIGGTANRGTTEGTNQLALFNGTAPAGTLTNGISLYSASGELRVMDAAGNSTLLSPHDKDGNWIHDEINYKGRRLRVDMERMVKALDEMLGGGFVQEFLIDK